MATTLFQCTDRYMLEGLVCFDDEPEPRDGECGACGEWNDTDANPYQQDCAFCGRELWEG